MTLIETFPHTSSHRVVPRVSWVSGAEVAPDGLIRQPVRRPVRGYHRTSVRGAGPTRRRPVGAPLRYRGTGVLMSQTSHRPRPITPATTVGLAVLAALITLWLGLVAHLGATAAAGGAPISGQLGVVRVQPGEGLQQLAVRVAPGAPADRVVDRIRELNQLDAVTLEAGQTLIAPIA